MCLRSYSTVSDANEGLQSVRLIQAFCVAFLKVDADEDAGTDHLYRGAFDAPTR